MDAERFLPNHYLIAVPAMHDPNFSRAVTLLCQHSEEGAMGVMINRVSNYRLGDILGQMDITSTDPDLMDAPVLSGGPMQPERGFVLHEPTAQEWDSSFQISPVLSLTTSRDILVAMARGTGPQRALVALGYAGWGTGQLEAELQENTWIAASADPSILFDTPIEQRWSGAARLIGIDLSLLTNYAGHA
jgi:putative transcriptional regulator